MRVARTVSLAVVLACVLCTVVPAASSPEPAGDLPFMLEGEHLLCTGFYWRPVPGKPDRAYFLSAGHCWQSRYVLPNNTKALWAKIPDARVLFLDVLIGETADARRPATYPAEMLDRPKAGDVHTALVMTRLRGEEPVFERVQMTFKYNLGGDSYVYDADNCMRGASSGSPVLTMDGRLVGVVVLGDTRSCKRVYVFPMTALYELRPDLRP